MITPRVTVEQHALNDIPDLSWLIEGDFVGQAQIAVAIPVVEEYLTKAAMTGWMARRMPGGQSLILKGGWVFDEGGFRLLWDGELCAIMTMVKVEKSIQ